MPSATAMAPRSWPPEYTTLEKYSFSGGVLFCLGNTISGTRPPEVLAGSTSASTEPFSDAMVLNLLPFLVISTAL